MSPTTASHQRARWLAISIYIAAALLGSLYLAWRTLAAADFLYPWLYDSAGIGAHIDEFAPQNRYRTDFEDTTRDERLRLFGEIVHAVRNGGQGLERIRYREGQSTSALIERIRRLP